MLDTQEVSGVTWYKIKTNTPRFPNRIYEGFVHGNFFRLMTAQEQAAWLLNPVQPGAAAPAPTATQAPGTPGGTVPSGSTDAGQVTGYVRITKGGTNLRQTPGGKTIETLAKGVVLAYYGPVASQGGYNWVFVRDTASGRYGYVRSDCYEFTDADGKPDTDNTKTPDTTVTTNYGLVTTAGASLRQTPGGVSVTAFPQYEIVTVLAAPPAVQAGWYQVTGRGFTGYIAESSLRLLTPAEAAAYLAVYTPSPCQCLALSAMCALRAAKPTCAISPTAARCYILIPAIYCLTSAPQSAMPGMTGSMYTKATLAPMAMCAMTAMSMKAVSRNQVPPPTSLPPRSLV